MNDEIIEKVAKEIADNHHKIIDDWCKAYLAQLYEEGHEIKPGCFTLNEQVPTYNKGLDCMVRKYWFEPGIPEFPHWSETKKGREQLLGVINEKFSFQPDGEIVKKNQWNNTSDILPKVSSEDEFDRGWVLGRFSRTKFCTCRYIAEFERWQSFDYSWCIRAPEQWMPLPDFLCDEWNEKWVSPNVD